MRCESLYKIEYRPRYSTVLFRHDLARFNVLLAIGVTPGSKLLIIHYQTVACSTTNGGGVHAIKKMRYAQRKVKM